MIKELVLAALLASAALAASDSQASARTLSDAEASALEGGAVTLTLTMQSSDGTGGEGEGEGEIPGEPWNHSDWWAKCVTDRNCSDTAEINNGLGCPSSFLSWGGWPQMCSSQRCVIACANDVAAELCKDDWFWDCYYIDDPDALPDCGVGSTGTCPYNTVWNDGLNVKTCTLAGGCTPDGRTIQCGTAHKCYSVD